MNVRELIMLKDIFEQSKNTKDLICIHLYDSEDDFVCGYVEGYNLTIIQMRNFDRHGYENGVVVEQIENIKRVDFDSEYEKTFNYIIQNKYDLNSIVHLKDFPNDENWRINYISEFIEKKTVVSLELNTDYVVCGIVLDYDNDEFVIKNIDSLGIIEGNSIYKIEDISSIRISDKECRLREYLFAWRTRSDREKAIIKRN